MKDSPSNTKSTVLITGGSGFIGRHLSQHWLKKGWRCIILSRQPTIKVKTIVSPEVEVIQQLEQLNKTDKINLVVNLAGAGIADARWSHRRKKILEDSRIELSQKLVHHLKQQQEPVDTFISASAIGYYGDHGAETINESATAKPCYTHQLCAQWEQAVQPITQQGSRLAILRIGLVLGPGGLLKRLSLPFKLGMGGRLGNGQQWMSWLSLKDFIDIIDFLYANKDCQGIINATAPNPVTNEEFTTALASQLNRWAILHTPAWVLKFLLGEMSQLLITGNKVMPTVLMQHGYQFNQPHLETALEYYLQ